MTEKDLIDIVRENAVNTDAKKGRLSDEEVQQVNGGAGPVSTQTIRGGDKCQICGVGNVMIYIETYSKYTKAKAYCSSCRTVFYEITM